jgi:hypothetical protein
VTFLTFRVQRSRFDARRSMFEPSSFKLRESNAQSTTALGTYTYTLTHSFTSTPREFELELELELGLPVVLCPFAPSPTDVPGVYYILMILYNLHSTYIVTHAAVQNGQDAPE